MKFFGVAVLPKTDYSSSGKRMRTAAASGEAARSRPDWNLQLPALRTTMQAAGCSGVAAHYATVVYN